ncbi:MAG: hypothetical protein KUG83_07390 [Gammaproteobacteria bacterium]|nr:hypothetical protein [Gammaproteobacteria bacterium]
MDQRDSGLKQTRLKPLNRSSFASPSERRQDYFEVVDWTGRSLREDKRGAIDEQLPPILQCLGIKPENWIDFVSRFHKYFLMRQVRLLPLSNSGSAKIFCAQKKRAW